MASLNDLLKKFGFIHEVNVILPKDDVNCAEKLKRLTMERHCYLLKDVDMTGFLSLKFINGILKTGHFYALSWNTRLDSADSVAVLPSGHIALHLTKETYESFGWTGAKSSFEKSNNKYVVLIDLTDDKVLRGSKMRARLLNCFARLNKKMSFVMSWEPFDSSTCPSSILDYFPDCDASRYWFRVETKSDPNSLVPSLSFDSSDAVNVEELITWSGAYVDAIPCSESTNPFISTFSLDIPTERVDNCTLFRLRGFITHHHLMDVIQTIQDNFGAAAWRMVTCIEAMDVPVNCALKETNPHRIHSRIGLLLLFPNERHWFIQGT